MKKIVGILAAAAVATSVFAADVSAATKIKGTLFSYDAAKTLALFTEVNDSHDYANPNITFSISDDKAGATIKLTTDGKDEAVKQTTQTIWFKPVDALKITVGNYDVALNKEQIDWTESVTDLGGNGYLLSVNVEGFGLDFGLSQADGESAFWLSKADGADPKISSFFVKAGYSADFGNIGAYVEFNRNASGRRKYAFHDDLFGTNPDHGGTWFATKDGAIKDIHFGAGYSNNFNGINMFVNVAGFMADKFEWIRPELYAAGSVEDFGYAAFVAPVIFTNSDYDIDPACELTVKLTYKIDSITPYVYFNDKDLLADDFVSTIKIGATGSVGAMGYNVWAQIDTGAGDTKDKVAFSVPVEFTVSF